MFVEHVWDIDGIISKAIGICLFRHIWGFEATQVKPGRSNSQEATSQYVRDSARAWIEGWKDSMYVGVSENVVYP